MSKRRPERGVTTAAQLLAKLQSQAPSASHHINTAFLDSLEQLCFYERPDLPPLLASLPPFIVTSLPLLLSSPLDVRHGRGVFTVRSLACYAVGRLSSLNAAAKLRLLADVPQLPRLVLGVLDERSPFSHVTSLNLLVDWGGERAVMDEVVAAGGVKRVVERYWHHDKVKMTSESDVEGREAQMAIKVFAISLLANVAQVTHTATQSCRRTRSGVESQTWPNRQPRSATNSDSVLRFLTVLSVSAQPTRVERVSRRRD